MKIYGFRYSATGVFGYVFYQGNREICRVSSLVVPSPTVHIYGYGREWCSPFDQESTLVTGLARFIYSADSDREECRLVYEGDRYDIKVGTKKYRADMAGEGYGFYDGEDRIAVMTRVSRQEAESLPAVPDENGSGMEAYYSVEIAEEVPSDVQMAILSFPVLRFDWGNVSEHVLFINACIRPDSRTLRLARRVLAKLGGQVEEVDLAEENLSPLSLPLLEKRDALLREGSFSDPMLRYARQYANADVIVIAAPFWDMSFPATVKIYYENIMAFGICFDYTPEGIPVGLCRARKLIYVTTAGGPMPRHNCGFEYVKALNDNFLGIPETVCFYADMLDIDGVDPEERLAAAMEEIDRSE